MRILFVVPNIPIPGFHGGSTHVTEVVREMRREHEVLLLARRGSFGHQTVGIGGKLAPGILRYLLPFKHFPRAFYHARKFKPDVVYDRFSSFGLGVLLAKALHIPVVSSVHDRSATLITWRGSDRFLSAMPSMVPAKYRHKAIEVVLGVNTELFHPALDGKAIREQLGIDGDKTVIGYTGGFYRWHDLETVIEAASLMRRTGQLEVCCFLLVGDGEFRREMMQMAKEMEVTDSFFFPGRVPYEQIPEYVGACDLCLAPYNPGKHKDMKEKGLVSYPLKVFEYLASGKPTITVDSPILQRVFRHRKHLLLLKPANPELLADGITQLLQDPELCRELAQNGRKIVEERFSWRAHYLQLNEILKELTASPVQ